MRFLVIGLGSMGKRRIRCLKKLGFNEIIGYDINYERSNQVSNLFNITTFTNFKEIEYLNFEAIFVCTPPDRHKEYVIWAINRNIPVFVEASVILEHSIEIKNYLLSSNKNVLIAPSLTFKFHPVINEIREIILNGEYGKVSNFLYHSGQYLPDWHPWEDIKDFYVSKRETGGAREIVAFELSWIVDVFGFPSEIKGFFGKTIDIGINIDDTYAFLLKFKDKHIFGNILVDVTSRYATRSLTINLEYAQIRWDWNKNYFELFDAINKRFIIYYQPESEAASGYNKNIIEDMYVKETKAFIDSIVNNIPFPNNLDNDIKVLELLKKIEDSDGGFLRE
ncbi:MAG: Gfo/Idh/MocA family oxidoreductase [bacterium]|nr:Gfo/Idh/MocA family oxidoreductase [bacterium]